MANEEIGFIGIGRMGWPMSANLLRAGFSVLPWDSDPAVRAKFAEEFGTPNPNGIGALAKARTIVTMLPTGPIVRQALMEGGADSLAASLAPGSVVIDMSSSEPTGTQQLAAQLKQHGITLIDAPVSGGVARAIDGTLAIMIGSDDDEAVKRVEPVLLGMGKRLFRTGGSGMGHAMKALNNMVSATTFSVTSEAVIIGKKFGLDPNVMIDIMNVSTGRSFASEIPVKEHVLTGKYATGFALGLMAKDVKIAEELARDVGEPAPIGTLVYSLLAQASDEIGPQADHTAAYKVWEKRSR